MKINPWALVATFAVIVTAVIVLIVTNHANAITVAVAGVTGFVTALLPVLSRVVSPNETRGDLQ